MNNFKLSYLTAVFGIGLIVSNGTAADTGFVPIFDGKTLTGWHVSAKTGHSRASQNKTGGKWVIEDVTIAPDKVRGPVMEFASASDAIVPLACSPDVPGREVLASGHVGMVIGGSAPTTLWPMVRRWILSHEAST